MSSPRNDTPASGDVTATSPPEAETGGAARRRADSSTFQPGDTVAERYLIRRFIAFGGMGEVYEAEDRVLRETVALKTIRAEVADDEIANERFKREILLARRVTHTNVCRIFDLGLHSATGRLPQTFLTMELLTGKTLSERIRTGGPIPVGSARPIVEQLTAALDAAHREGIVHRDFKSGNVMLCVGGKDGELRVVVTDFGLARGDADPFATNATSNVAMMGSPAYMAPEQVEGGPITRAADIYALGVVMYEMVTSRVPFNGETAIACAVKRLKEAPSSPRVHVPDLEPVWERTILRCLERDPAARFASAGDVLRALDGAEPVTPNAATVAMPASARRARRARRWWLAAGAAALLVSGAAWHVLRRDTEVTGRPPATAQVAAARRSIAVLGFKNLARRDEVAWLSTALAEMLTTEMGAGGELRTLPGESVARMKKELTLEDAESYAPDTLKRIRKNLSADYIVLGSFVPTGDGLRLDVRLQSTATGETLLQVADTGSEAELAALVRRTGAQLRAALRMGEMNDAERALVSATLPGHPEAARLYAEGLAQLRLFSAGRARELLERAVELEPGFPQSHAALSEALAYLGHEARAKEEARRAVDLSAGLPEAQRLRVEGLYHGIAGDERRAGEAYRRLFELEPDVAEWGMRLASTLYAAGQDAEADAVVAQLRARPDAEDDPRIFMVLVQAALAKQSFQEVRDNAARLAATGEARGALSLVGEARHAEAMALWFEGELGTAVKRADEARQISFRLGDRDGVAAAATTKAFVLTERGELAEAARVARTALDAAAEVGARRRIWLAEHVLARVGLFGGDLAAARRHYEASRQAAKEVGSQYGEALANLGHAVTLAAQGELDAAEAIYARMSLGFRLFAPEHNLAFLRYYRGLLELDQGDLGAARKELEDAVRLAEKHGERVQAERARAALALVSMREGKLDDAVQHARAAAGALAELDLPGDVAQARATLALVLSAQGQGAAAEAALDEGEAAGVAAENILVRLDLALARGEVSTRSSRPGAAARALAAIEPALEEAADKGYTGRALELRLARAGALHKARRGAEATLEIGKIVAEAERLGYADVLRRAKALPRSR